MVFLIDWINLFMLQTIANSPNKRKKSHKNGWLRAIFLAFVSPYLAYIMFSRVLSFWFTEFCKISFCRLGEENADQDDPFGRGYQPFNSQRYDWLQEETKTHSSLKSSRDLTVFKQKTMIRWGKITSCPYSRVSIFLFQPQKKFEAPLTKMNEL